MRVYIPRLISPYLHTMTLLDAHATNSRLDVARVAQQEFHVHPSQATFVRLSSRPENREGAPIIVGSPLSASGRAPGQQLHR